MGEMVLNTTLSRQGSGCSASDQSRRSGSLAGGAVICVRNSGSHRRAGRYIGHRSWAPASSVGKGG